jgi:hypothetical protein
MKPARGLALSLLIAQLTVTKGASEPSPSSPAELVHLDDLRGLVSRKSVARGPKKNKFTGLPDAGLLSMRPESRQFATGLTSLET